MTASQVIEETEKLPNDERAKVIDFARSAPKKGMLSLKELGHSANACRMQPIQPRQSGSGRNSSKEFTARNECRE